MNIPVLIQSPEISGSWQHRPLVLGAPSPVVLTGIKHYGADYSLQVARYDVYQVLYVLDGALELESGDKRQFVNAGDGILYRANSSYHVSAPGRSCRVLYVSRQGGAEFLRRGKTTAFKGDHTMTQLAALLHAQVDAAEHQIALILALGDALFAQAEFLAPLPCNAPSSSEYSDTVVAKARQLLEASVRSGLTACEVLRTTGLSYRQTARLFRAQTGVSPKRYQLNARIDAAKHLLREPSIRIGEIAKELHFSSSQHLSRQFHERTGMTPREYRTSQARDAD